VAFFVIRSPFLFVLMRDIRPERYGVDLVSGREESEVDVLARAYRHSAAP
jgi:hypothetical protein